MSTPTILPGQFFNVVSETNEPSEGWTVIDVISGDPDSPEPQLESIRVAVIRNDLRTSRPEWMPYAELLERIANAEWNPVSAPARPVVPIEDLSEKLREKVQRLEDGRYELIRPILETGRDALRPRLRRKVMKEISSNTGKSIDLLWQLLCAYWQFGGKRGLRPRACLAGQKSLQARFQGALDEARKRDQPPQKAADHFAPYTPGRRRGPGVLEGKCMDMTDIKRCRRGALKFLFRKSHDGKLHYCYDYAYTETLREFYGYALHSGESQPVPSLSQFITAVKSDPEFDKLSVRIVGKMSALRNHRTLKHTTRFESLGPGHILQTDEVDSKVVIVDPIHRLPIGRAMVYVGTDQWAKCIVGVHDTLADPNYEGVKELLINVACSKEDYFRQQRIEIELENIVGHGVFRYIATDNGPLGGSLGNILPNDLCDLSNMAAYRPDLKADIESSFHAYLRQCAQRLPGFNRVSRPGEHNDPNAIACLTAHEFRQLFWSWVSIYNSRALDSYLPEAALFFPFEKRPSNTPAALWRWGLLNVSGSLRSVPEDELRRKLLRKGTGTIHPRRGLLFMKLHYYLDEAPEFRFKSSRVEIRYSNNYARQIFVWLDGRSHTATMNSEEARIFGDLTFPEIEREKKFREEQARAAKSQNRITKVKSSRLRLETIENAVAQLNESSPSKKLRKLATNSSATSRARKSELSAAQRTLSAADRAVFPEKKDDIKQSPPVLHKLSLRQLLEQKPLSTEFNK